MTYSSCIWLFLTWDGHQHITNGINPHALARKQLRERKERSKRENSTCEWHHDVFWFLTSSMVVSEPLRFSVKMPSSAPKIRCWSEPNKRSVTEGFRSENAPPEDGGRLPLVTGCSHEVEQLSFRGHPWKTFLKTICQREQYNITDT